MIRYFKPNQTSHMTAAHHRRVIIMALFLCVCIGCSKTPQPPEPEVDLPLPEVKEIRIMGNTHFSSRSLRREMATKTAPFYLPWKKGEPYNPPTVEADLKRLQKYYFDRGYLHTVVRLQNVRLEPEEPNEREAYIDIAIEEGPLTTVSEVRVTGEIPPALPSAAELRDALPLQAGDPINKTDFDRSKTQLLRRLQNAGYARARVRPQTEVDTQNHTASVTFELVPGELTEFGSVTIQGANQVQESTIRRALKIRQGERYSADDITDSTDAIYDLGMFLAVTPRAENLAAHGAPLNLSFEVQERRPRTVRLGVGFSTVERFFFDASWLHRNLAGGAQRLRLSAHLGSFEQSVEARLHLPYVLMPRTTFTQTIFVRNEQELNTDPTGISDAIFNIEDPSPNFDQFSVGGESRLGHQFSRRLGGFSGLELSYNDFHNINEEALAVVGEAPPEDNLLLIQFAELIWNTSDDPLNPTRGWLLRGRVDNANRALLSDATFVKLTVEGRYYQPLWDHIILATRLKLGGIEPYGDDSEVPFNVRFFAGGPGSVRGFALDKLGPLDAEGGPIGGNSLLEGSVEVRFPIVGALGGAVFIDFGNVFRDSFTYPLDDLRYSVGPGIRYNTPIGPVRLDVGFIVDRRSGEDLLRVDLSIGQPF
jgi:outer membrane protein assembly complex protein YaeT